MALGAVATAQQNRDARQNRDAAPQAVEAAGRTPAPVQQVERADDAATPVVNPDERSFTKPSEERAFNFSTPGLVLKVNVKDGEAVKAGQVLAEQDVSVETANKATYEIDRTPPWKRNTPRRTQS